MCFYKYYESSLYTRVIGSMILVVIKLYVLSVILCGDSRHHYRAVCRNYSMCVFAVVMFMLQYVLWRLILSYLIFGTAVIGLYMLLRIPCHCVCIAVIVCIIPGELNK